MISKKKLLGEYLRNERMKKRLTIKHVASVLGIDKSLWAKIERGERTFSMDLVPSLAGILKVDFKDLQTEVLAKIIIEEYGNEEYVSEGMEKALKNIR